MFKEKDYVRYGSRGIFQVEQIIKKELKPRHPETCYVLSSVYGIHTQIVTPASNPQLRRVMNREEIDRMIDEMPLLESDWIDDKRKREENLPLYFRRRRWTQARTADHFYLFPEAG